MKLYQHFPKIVYTKEHKLYSKCKTNLNLFVFILIQMKFKRKFYLLNFVYQFS